MLADVLSFLPGSVPEPQVGLPVPPKADTGEKSFAWKGIGALFRRLATWREGTLLSKGQLRGFCLAQGFIKGFRAVNQ